MAFIGTGVEYALHCLVWLKQHADAAPSSRDLAKLQGVSPTFLAKLLPKLEKAGILTASEGLRGGYRLAQPADQIRVLDVVEAIEGRKRLFDCQQVRARCVLFDGDAPGWAVGGVCGIHAVMLRSERAMRDELARTTLSDIVRTVGDKAPSGFDDEVQAWLSDRSASRKSADRTGRGDASALTELTPVRSDRPR